VNAPLKAVHFEDPLAAHVRAMLEALGENPQREGLLQTPARYAKAMRYLAGGYAQDVDQVVGDGVFAAEGEGAVVVRDIEFHSLCEHHLLPFYGRVHVGYLPAGRIIGGVVVLAEARHLCMAMRGVQKQHSSTTTRATRGAYHEIPFDADQRHSVAIRG
jgi:GTP cyclohydrolase I